jgi:hypothetical protein
MVLKTIDVDVDAICSVLHHCTGCRGAFKLCCASYEVTISSRELKNIVGCIPLASRFSPRLKSRSGYENVFDKISRNLYSIDTDEEGMCVFAYHDMDKIACSLHTVSEKLGIPLRQAKPLSCLLWPLSICEGETNILSIQDDISEFSCISNNEGHADGPLSLCPSIARNVDAVFGIQFMNDLQDAANKGLHWTSIPLRGLLASDP